MRWRPGVAVSAVLAGLALMLAGLHGAAGPAEAQAPDPDAPGLIYRLSDTWRERPWTLTAGRYGQVSDTSSAPDGTVFVLDTRRTAGRSAAVHVLAPDGTPRHVWIVPGELGADGGWSARRIDVGFDGVVHVLSEGPVIRLGTVTYSVYRIYRLTPDGEVIDFFERQLETPRRYVDLAVAPDRRVYVTRTGRNPWCLRGPEDAPPTPTPHPERPDLAVYSIDYYSADGSTLRALTPPELGIPGAVDVSADGTIYVTNRVASPCDIGGGGDPGDPPATPRPSMEGAPAALAAEAARPAAPAAEVARSAAPAAGVAHSSPPARGAARPAEPSALLQDPPAGPENGILVIGADHAVVETVPFIAAEEVATGPAGTFVARQIEIFHMLEPGAGPRSIEGEPMHTGPSGRTYAGYLGRPVYFLDVPADGRLQAAMDHCYFKGLVRFDDTRPRPAPSVLIGALDAPELEGPPYPARVAADLDVGVLLGRMRITGNRPGQRYVAATTPTEYQTVQRWNDGALGSQLGTCGGSQAWWTRDVAVDGNTVYTIDAEFLQQRPDDLPPLWSWWSGLPDPPEDMPLADPFLSAVSADAGRAAVLDQGTDRVLIVDSEGGFERGWKASGTVSGSSEGGAGGDGARGASLPGDLALHGDRVYLSDPTRARITVRDLDGGPIDQWQTHDGPIAIAAGPTGDVFVLGRGGWAFRYAPDGRLRAAWPMPLRGVQSLDIAVSADGLVHVPFVEVEVGDPLRRGNIGGILDAGVWVFAPATEVESPAPPPGRACIARPDKYAAPRRIPLGDTVDVTLEVEGVCPGRREGVQLAVVFDTSRSMGTSGALEPAKDVTLALLSALDPDASSAALITFDEGPILRARLGDDMGTVRAAVAGLRADGDTLVEASLDAARLELTGERADPLMRRIVVLVTDGGFHDVLEGISAGTRLLAEGIEVHAVVYPSAEVRDGAGLAPIEALVGDPGRVIAEAGPAMITAWVDGLTGYIPERGLFETITVIDEVPENMRYIESSAVPSAAWDPATRTLTWTFRATDADERLTMRYRLEPLQVGTWPTNVSAKAPYEDAVGASGRLVFPIPIVEVFAPKRTVYLPVGFSNACVRKGRPLDVILVIDASSSMDQPTAAGDRTKIEAAREAAAGFLALLELQDGAGSSAGSSVDVDRDHAAIVDFNVDSRIASPLSADEAALRTALDGITTRRGTRIDLGLEQAARALADRRNAALPVVILLSDGIHSGESIEDVYERAAGIAAVAPDAVIFTIGLGEDVDVELLRALATGPERFYRSPDAEDLAAIYAAVYGRVGCG